MSDAFAIAAVTAVLRRTLIDAFSAAALSDTVGTVAVTALPPDRVIPTGGADPTQVNIFLRQVSRNAAFRNVDLPSRNAAGTLVSGPPLALDLHYFVTAYGAEMFEAEMLFGHAALALHENATLTREAIRRALSPNPPDPAVPPVLAAAGLDAQVELIKLLPEAVDSEEMSRLWSAIQGQYRLTGGWRASVLLMEPRAAGAAPPPVRTPAGRAVSMATPRLDRVRAESGPDQPVSPASTILLEGQRFAPGEMTVEIGGTTATPAQGDITSTVIRLDLGPVTGLRAGLQPVRAVRSRTFAPPPATPVTDVSESRPLRLHPDLSVTGVSLDATGEVGGVPVATGSIAVAATPEIGRRQAVALYLTVAGSAEGARRLSPPPDNGAGAEQESVGSVAFGFRDLPRGDYLARLSVDGAESLLTLDPDGVYDGPVVTI